MTRIPKAEYARRRKALMAEMEPNSIAILPAARSNCSKAEEPPTYRKAVE